jgi:putative oxidoreductase
MTGELASGLFIVGRVLLGGIFAFAGLRHFVNLTPLTTALEQRGVAAPRAVLLAGTAFQIVAGLALMLGIFVTLASLGLIVFTIVASLLLDNFWDKQGAERIAVTNSFYKNVGLVGGLMLTTALGLLP